ncbi:hypothetical protein SAMN05444416_109143 [Thermoactinomyces sp. DSM 45892]|nr:hypothetical protein SAMN05444416_109143 [Thermoactinomyces sp. DSM 45892]
MIEGVKVWFRDSEMLDIPYINNQEYSASRAAKILGKYSIKWLTQLALRCNRIGLEWPKRVEQEWIAPLEEWKRIVQDETLRSWMTKK